MSHNVPQCLALYNSYKTNISNGEENLGLVHAVKCFSTLYTLNAMQINQTNVTRAYEHFLLHVVMCPFMSET